MGFRFDLTGTKLSGWSFASKGPGAPVGAVPV